MDFFLIMARIKEDYIPMAPDTGFRIYSMTKPIKVDEFMEALNVARELAVKSQPNAAMEMQSS